MVNKHKILKYFCSEVSWNWNWGVLQLEEKLRRGWLHHLSSSSKLILVTKLPIGNLEDYGGALRHIHGRILTLHCLKNRLSHLHSHKYWCILIRDTINDIIDIIDTIIDTIKRTYLSVNVIKSMSENRKFCHKNCGKKNINFFLKSKYERAVSL